MKRKAERLLGRLRSHPVVTWSLSGEISYRGTLVRDSSLVDLINDVLKKRQTAPNPREWKTFTTALRRINVPQDLVGQPCKEEKRVPSSPYTPLAEVGRSSWEKGKEADEL